MPRRIILLYALLLCLTAPMHAEPNCSFGLEADASFATVDDISQIKGGLGIYFEIGGDITQSVSMFGYGNAMFSLPFLDVNPFLHLSGSSLFEFGAGCTWRLGRWTFGGRLGIGASGPEDFKFAHMMIGTITRYSFAVMDEEPIGYSIGFPLTMRFGGDSFDVSFGITLSMDVSAAFLEKNKQ